MLFMIEGEIISDRSIGMLVEDAGIGRINEGVFDGAAFFVTGIIIG